MPHWKLLTDRDFLGACDVDGRGDVTVTIAKVEQGSIARAGTSKKERKGVITFNGSVKRWVLNSTNGKTIEKLYGADYTQWPGKRITLYCTDTRDPSGGTCRGIRVRPVEPGERARAGAPEPAAPPVDVQAELSGQQPGVQA